MEKPALGEREAPSARTVPCTRIRVTLGTSRLALVARVKLREAMEETSGLTTSWEVMARISVVATKSVSSLGDRLWRNSNSDLKYFLQKLEMEAMEAMAEMLVTITRETLRTFR